jgi:gluconate:H+ symporter, GntP family
LVLMLVFPVLFTDVQMVVSAPLVRNLGKRLGPGGLAKMASATMMGSQLGSMFVIPGVSLLAISGQLKLPLTSVLGYGLLVGIPTGVISVFLYAQLIRMRMWNPSTDELREELRPAGRDVAVAEARAERVPHRTGGGADDAGTGEEPDGADRDGVLGPGRPGLGICLLPLLLALALVVLGGVFEVVQGDAPGGLLGLLTSPVVALFLGFALSYAMVWRYSSSERVDAILADGLKQCGMILVLTGISGSLAGVISASPLGDVLTGLFTASALAPLLLAWVVACVIHLMIGSTSLAAISTAGILVPVLAQVATPAPLIALAIGSGALFAIQVNSNGFWMWQTLLSMTTRGTLKTVTVPTMLISVVSLGMILIIDLFV